MVKIVSGGVCLFVFICCCLLTDVTCVVSTRVRINQNNFVLFFFSSPESVLCSSFTEVAVCPQGGLHHSWWWYMRRKNSWEFRSAEFGKLWNILKKITHIWSNMIPLEDKSWSPKGACLVTWQNRIALSIHLMNESVDSKVCPPPRLELLRNINTYVFWKQSVAIHNYTFRATIILKNFLLCEIICPWLPLASVYCKVFWVFVVFGDKTDQLCFTREHWGLIVKCCVDKLTNAKQN